MLRAVRLFCLGKTTILCLIAIWLFAGAHFCYADDFEYAQPYFQNVGDATSIPSGVVTAIDRAPDGLLWLGTQSGVLRYDGYHFKRYQFDPENENSIAGDFISAIKIARDGRVWIGTLGDGVSILDPATDQVLHLRHAKINGSNGQLSDDNVRAFAEPKVGMWIGTQAGLDYYHEGKIENVRADRTFANAVNVDFVRSLLLDQQGKLLVGSNDGLHRLVSRPIVQLSGGRNLTGSGLSTLALVPLASVASAADSTDTLAGQGVNAILQLRNGDLLLATRLHGLAHLSFDRSADSVDDGNLPSLHRIFAADQINPISSRVQAMLQISADEIWLATTAGLDVIDAHSFALKQHWLTQPGVAGALGFDAIGALALDPSGLVWVGTWGGGLQKTVAKNLAFRTLRLDAQGSRGLSYADVHSVLELRDQRLLVGTGGNGIDVLDRTHGRIDGFRVNANDPAALSDGVVIALKQAADDSVWVGTQTAGLFHLNMATRKFTHVGERGAVSNLLIASDGALWLGGSLGVARLAPNWSTPELVKDTEGKAILGQLNPLVQDQSGRIWAGGNDGLRLLSPGKKAFQIFRHEEGRSDSLAHNTVYDLMVDRDGAVWVATLKGVDRLTLLPEQGPTGSLEQSAAVNGNLVAQFPRASFRHVSSELGMPGRDIGGNLLQDARGRVWTDHMVLDLAQRSIYALEPADGVDVGTAWAGAHTQTHDGLLLNGGSTGLVIMDPSQFQPWTFAPTVIATELRINGLTTPLAQLLPQTQAKLEPDAATLNPPYGGLTLRPDQRRFSIEFAALDFSASPNNRYEYRLAGFDEHWIATDAEQRSASYSNLWPRTYQLEVRGSNRVGAWSPKVLRIPIKVLPAFWQTPWFALLVLALTAAVIALALRRRTRHLQLRSERLDALVHARTAELETANTRLLATQAQLAQQEKLASLGQLVAGVAHEVNTPLGVALTASTFLQQRSGEISRAIAAAAMTKSELERFISDANQSSALVSTHLERAANLVRQFKQVSIDRASDERREVRLDLLMRELIDSSQSLWKRRAINLIYTDAPEIMLDTYTGAIGQILNNLLNNALLHAFEPEQVSTSEASASIGCISIGVRVIEANAAGATQVELMVSDDGVGMDAATTAHIFEPFFTTKRNQGGIGLGLHVVFNLATARLGGNINVHSELGVGSRFIVRFPARLGH